MFRIHQYQSTMTNSTVKDITPPEAWEILQSNQDAMLVDVRTTIEYQYVGHPLDAIHVPWKEAPDWEINTDFVKQAREAIARRAGKTEGIESLPILTICRSGKRSKEAAEALLIDGFKTVYNVDEGFEGDRDSKNHRNTINGWRFHNLPWEQS